jgi:protein TonB
MKERFMFTAPVSRSLPNNNFEAELGGRTVADVSAMEESAPQAQLLVLSRNPELVEVVRNAGRTVARVAQARDLDDAARSLSHMEPGVLLVDGAIADDIGTIIAQSMRRFPEAVVVVVGTREESSELMQLAAAGRIFRFLLMPLSYGPVRLTLAAAVSQHIERKAVNRSLASVPRESGPSRRKHALAYLVLAALLFTTIGVLWRVSGLLAVKAPVSAAATMSAPRVTGLDTAPTQLAQASKALADGRYVEPAGNSALDLYRNVLQADPENETARAGIRAIADELLQRAEQAMVAESLEDAERILRLVREVEADNPRLGFLDSRVVRERELRNLSQRREVANRVRQLVNAARSDMRAGNLIGTAVEGAAGALLAARKLDPADPAVVESVRDLSTALADAVRMALAAGDTPRAQAFANAARRLGAGEQLLPAIERSLKESKRAAAPVANPTPVPSPPTIIEPIAEQTVRAADATPAPGRAEEVLQAAELRRIKQVMPSYPIAAAADGIEGYVDLEFTIATDGVPRNLVILAATPRRVFDAAALNCVRQWRFEPLEENGLPVSRRAALRVRFQLK